MNRLTLSLLALWVSAAGAALGQFRTSLPHVAVGGPFTTIVTIAATTVLPQTLTLQLYDDQGNPMPASIDGGAPAATFSLALPGRTIRVLVLAAAGPARAGWVAIGTDSAPVQVSARFVVAAGSGAVADTVAVLPPENDRNWTVFFRRESPSENVGVALANPEAKAMVVGFELFRGDGSGGAQRHVDVTVPPFGHYAAFVTEIFGQDVRGVGALKVQSNDHPFPVLALIEEQGQLSSLPAGHDSAYVTFVIPASAPDSGRNAWFINLLDTESIAGVEVRSGERAGALSGFVDIAANRLAFERRAKISDGVAEGLVIYQGNFTGSQTLAGVQTVLREDGTVVSRTTFSATVR